MCNLKEKQYLLELNGINASSYQQLLVSSEFYDCDKPFHEFSAWSQRWENIFHRLRYLTHCIVLVLSKCSPSIIDKRIPETKDRPFTLDTELNSIVFLDAIMYMRDRDSDFNQLNSIVC